MILQAGLGLLFILKHIDRLSSEYLFLGASHVVQNETLFVFVSTYKTPLFLKKKHYNQVCYACCKAPVRWMPPSLHDSFLLFILKHK